MNELVALVAQRSGLSPENAQKAVEAVLDILKEKLPAPLANHLQAFIDGGLQGEAGTIEGEVGEILKGKLGGMLGGIVGGSQMNR
jgi:hypothetical protein